jgi:hypothetical protein
MFSSVGLSLQKLHPEAQTGGSASNVISEPSIVESIKEEENVIEEWI